QGIYPGEILFALLAMRLSSPVKWIETRHEHLTNAAHAREQWHDIELAARRDGTIVGMRAELLADAGAYTRSLGVLCPSITAASLPGPYRIRDYTCRVRAALTCKAPAAAYRGAACWASASPPTCSSPDSGLTRARYCVWIRPDTRCSSRAPRLTARERRRRWRRWWRTSSGSSPAR